MYEYVCKPAIKASKLPLSIRPNRIRAKFQIVVPNNDKTTNVTTFILLIPTGIVMSTRNTGIKRHSSTAHAP